MALVARATGVLPLVCAVLTAAALTGAAVFTVEQTSCPAPSHYVRDSGQVQLVGGCLNNDELPAGSPLAAGNSSRP
jgi:hypothetical protein